MSLASDGWQRLRALLRRGRVEAELDEELRFHLEQETAARRRAGAGPEEARRQAMVAFGGIEDVKEQVRDARGVRPLEDLLGDLRYAARGLRRSPVYALAAVAVLGLGIGAAAAVFSVLDAVLLTALPYPEPDRLVAIFEQNSPTNTLDDLGRRPGGDRRVPAQLRGGRCGAARRRGDLRTRGAGARAGRPGHCRVLPGAP